MDKATASLFRKEAYACRKNFIIKPSTSLQHETVVAFMRLLNGLSQKDLIEFKEILESVCQDRAL
ncbi:hypothetical protein ABID23_001518 [Bartonella silvatica]|uniref:MarR family transcriptional regulator n=1 Tax=Bartonella silvatica TaxID=357760 RepID=A0ABV2HJ04_9HYPH